MTGCTSRIIRPADDLDATPGAHTHPAKDLPQILDQVTLEDDEVSLVGEFDVDGTNADEILGYKPDGEGDDFNDGDLDDGEEDGNDEDGNDDGDSHWW